MYRFLYSIYYIRFHSKRLDWLFLKLYIRIFNVVVPVYFRLTSFRKKYRLTDVQHIREIKYVVSLTTFPERIENVWLVIETILRQKTKPDVIILWLYEGEFPDKNFLPGKLLNLEKRGLQIRFCDDNLMPHKKYYYTLQAFPNANIITIDDDFFYPVNLIRNLLSYHERYPKSICCTRSREIKISQGCIQSYQKWPNIKVNTEPSYKYLTMGGGGTLFPPFSLSAETLNRDAIKEFALTADDLWLKVMSLLNKTKVGCLGGEYPRVPIPIRNKSGSKLMDKNISLGQNDIIFSSLIKKYNIPVCVFDDEKN